MSKYAVFFTLRAEAIARAMQQPSDRVAVVSKAVESAGGKLEAYYLMFGQYDGFAIVDLPDSRAAAASTAGRSTATATYSTWSTAPGRWWRSWTGWGGSGGRASAALRGQGCGHGGDGWQAPPQGAARLAACCPPHGDGSTARASRTPASVAMGGPDPLR